MVLVSLCSYLPAMAKEEMAWVPLASSQYPLLKLPLPITRIDGPVRLPLGAMLNTDHLRESMGASNCPPISLSCLKPIISPTNVPRPIAAFAPEKSTGSQRFLRPPRRTRGTDFPVRIPEWACLNTADRRVILLSGQEGGGGKGLARFEETRFSCKAARRI